MTRFPFVCPRCTCAIALDDGATSYECKSCSATYPVVLGIPDFRLRRDPIYAPHAESGVVDRLITEYPHRDFASLYDFYWQMTVGLKDPQFREQQFQRHRHHAFSDRSAEMWASVQAMTRTAGQDESIGFSVAVDLGCGVGSYTTTLAPWQTILATDISLPSLIVAKKHFEERGVTGVHLACADAGSLPVSHGSIDMVFSNDMIEHVPHPMHVVKEIRRVVGRPGLVFMTSPNRFTVYREQHIGVWGVGFCPRQLANAYTVWVTRGKKDYVGKQLLSRWELRRIFAKFFGRQFTVRSLLSTRVNMSSPSKTFLGRTYRNWRAARWLYESSIGSPFVYSYCVLAWK